MPLNHVLFFSYTLQFICVKKVKIVNLVIQIFSLIFIEMCYFDCCCIVFVTFVTSCAANLLVLFLKSVQYGLKQKEKLYFLPKLLLVILDSQCMWRERERDARLCLFPSSTSRKIVACCVLLTVTEVQPLNFSASQQYWYQHPEYSPLPANVFIAFYSFI